MDVFSLFATTPYTFLQLASGSGGNKEIAATDTTGIFKFRDGMVRDGRSEAYASATTMKMRPAEPFIATVGGPQALVGHGVRVNGTDYRIEAVTSAQNLETGSVYFYTCTLKREALWAESALPLE